MRARLICKNSGGAAIETIWAERADAHNVAQAFDALDAAEIVVKPQVGAGSIETVRLKRNAWSEADLRDGPRGPAMIQPYLRSIETEGERSLFWFGGDVFARHPQSAARGRVGCANIPGKTRFHRRAPPAQALEAAESARAKAPQDLLYVRIDLVLGDDGKWRVIEIEAIEPYLFLDFAPEGARLFRRCARARLGRIEAEIRDRTARAFRFARDASVAPVQDQPMVRAVQIFRRRDFHQLRFDLGGGFAARQAGAVGDAEHMRIDGDGGFAEHFHQHHIGGLTADAGQRFKRLALARHFAAVLFEQMPAKAR